MARIFLMLTTFLLILGACTSQQEGQRLFEEHCIQCHALEKALKVNKSLAEWEKTTETMARYSEGAIIKKDAEKIAKYLAERNENN